MSLFSPLSLSISFSLYLSLSIYIYIYIERRLTQYREERDSSSIERRECLSSIWRGERLLLYREEADSFAVERREVSLLNIERRETPSLYKGEIVSLLYVDEVDTS